MATVSADSVSHAHLYVESDMQSAELLSLSAGNVAAFCRRCPDKAEPNDDSAAVIHTAGGAAILVVADGVGGSALGHKASAIAVQAIAEKTREATADVDLRPAILDGIELANREILDLAVGAATTLAVVEIHKGVARGYQVGDSTSLIVGQRGAVKWKSTAHSPVGYAVESGMLDENDALNHGDLHIVSNVVGSKSMHIEIGPARALALRDTVIVGSDGLWDNLRMEEVVQHGRAGRLEHRMRRLVELAEERMNSTDQVDPSKPDDLTILMFVQ